MNPASVRYLRLPSLFLAGALQLLPIVRAALPVTQNAANVIVMIFRWATGAAALAGGVNAVSGASTVITNPLTRTGTNGVSFSLRLTTAPDQAHFWTASGLPAGLGLTGTSGQSLWSIDGTPTQSGSFSVPLTAQDQSRSSASRTVTATLNLTIVSGAPTPPSISSQPANQTGVVGGSASFSVTASGSSPLVYQWRKGGSDLSGKTNSTLSLTGLISGDAGSYDVVITNSAGSITSSVATLTVNTPPSISVQPQNVTVAVSQTANFSVTAAGTATLYYYWKKGTAVVSSGATSTYSIPNAQSANAGTYSVIVSNLAGTVTSSAVTLNVDSPPVITTQPTNRTAILGSSAAFTVTVGGTAPFGYQWHFGAGAIQDATNVTLSLTHLALNEAGNYTVVITNTLGSVTSSVAVLTINSISDTVKPTLTVKSPAAASSLSTSNQINVSGIAGDNFGLDRIVVYSSSGATVVASGTSNWTAVINLDPGTNVLKIAAHDLVGNAVTNSRSIFFSVLSPLSLSTNGRGGVTGATNGQRLEVGKGYALTAKPATGCVFSNWTGTVTSTANPLLFLMQSNMVLAANFVTNPFVASACVGTYVGLWYDSNNVQVASAGFLTLTLSSDGKFSARLLNGAKRSSFSGRFDLDGVASNSVARPKTNALIVLLQLDLHGADQISGTITDGSWTSSLLTHRSVFNKATRPATNLAHPYTVLLPGAVDDSAAPAGDGFGTVKIDLAGNNTFAGTLADGTRLALRAPVSAAGDWPFYVPLYRGTGAALGWLVVEPGTLPAIQGTVHWLRTAGTANKYYTNGFALDSALAGSVYTPPGTNHLLSADSAEITFEGGNLAGSLTNLLAFGPSGRVTNQGPATLTFTPTTSSGLFKGTVLPPGALKSVPFQGAVLQGQLVGGGYFLGTNRSGNVTITTLGGGH